MRMVLDAMGSDAAPGPEVEGAVEASRANDINIILVGDEPRVQAELAKYPACPNISVIHASESVAMDENPALAVRVRVAHRWYATTGTCVRTILATPRWGAWRRTIR